MAVPKYYEFYGLILQALQDGELHTFKEVKTYIIGQLNPSHEDLTEMLPSGKQTVMENRIGWGRTYLKKAGLLESPAKGQLRLSSEEIRALSDADHIDNDYLKKYPSFRDFTSSEESSVPDTIAPSDSSPEERLENAFQALNTSLAEDLMAEIMKLTSSDFERLVVQLLLRMGYGSGIDEAGFVTQASNDGGIDGIIKEDQLGFSSIYIQAKQWDLSRSVDRPEIQKFAGALQEQKASKGLFITTASFSSGAQKSAEVAGIVLVDGKQLTKLMTKFNLGVSTEHIYEVKRIDSDFFSEGF